MASVTHICNLALSRFGQKRIESISDNNSAARLCDQFYEQTRDEILRTHRWNFALTRAELTQNATAPLFGYDYAYDLPTDFIRVASVNESEILSETLYEIEGDQLLSDSETIELRYIRQVTDTNKFEPLFISALSTKLAAQIAPSLSGDWQLGEKFMQEYLTMSLNLARRIDAAEGNPKKPRKSTAVDSKLVRSRYGV